MGRGADGKAICVGTVLIHTHSGLRRGLRTACPHFAPDQGVATRIAFTLPQP
ncbi:MAG: hypothetical protein ACFFA6_15560 [Promethearchaeota archaeon]